MPSRNLAVESEILSIPASFDLRVAKGRIKKGKGLSVGSTAAKAGDRW